jgi:hypothetical protein
VPVKKLVSGFLGLTPTQEQIHFDLAKSKITTINSTEERLWPRLNK